MIRNLVKFRTTSIPKINSSNFVLRNKTFDFLRLNAASVCSYQQNKLICSDPTGNNLLGSSSYNVIKTCVRFKSKDKKSRTRQDDSDDEEDEVDEYDEDGNLVKLIKLKSLRSDSVLGKVMNLTRRKIDDSFLESKFRHNGQKLSKKSMELKEGDTLEFCTDPVDIGASFEVVATLKVLKIKPTQESSTFLMTYTLDKQK